MANPSFSSLRRSIPLGFAKQTSERTDAGGKRPKKGAKNVMIYLESDERSSVKGPATGPPCLPSPRLPRRQPCMDRIVHEAIAALRSRPANTDLETARTYYECRCTEDGIRTACRQPELLEWMSLAARCDELPMPPAFGLRKAEAVDLSDSSREKTGVGPDTRALDRR